MRGIAIDLGRAGHRLRQQLRPLPILGLRDWRPAQRPCTRWGAMALEVEQPACGRIREKGLHQQLEGAYDDELNDRPTGARARAEA